MQQEIDDNEDWLEDDVADTLQSDKCASKWRILIVDDEVDVHAATRLALNNITFKNQEIEILSAYSGEEGFQILLKNQDICMVLLDVVMETESAGLELAQRIRHELKNDLVRIICKRAASTVLDITPEIYL